MRRILLALLLSAATPAPAQDDNADAPVWYQVEVIIFANRSPEAALAESWPALPDLAYPAQWQSLRDGPPDQPGDREYDLVRIEDTVPELYDLFWQRSVKELLDAFRRKQVLREPDIELEPLFELTVPRLLVKLPPEQRGLNAQARRIRNSAGLDVLFHESWLQRIGSEGASLPIIVDTPERYGDYPELQGSLLLYSSRYLHVSTNLWLTTNGGYLDEATAGWRMPPPPLPVDQAPPDPVPFRIAPPPDWLADDANNVDAALEDGTPGTAGDRRGELPAGEPADLPAASDTLSAEAPSEDLKHAPASADALQAFLDAPIVDYDFRHAVLVRQQRRMRSGELHYIDHPMLGIVIQVNRYEFAPFVAPAQ